MTNILELAERVEKLTGPDREMDAEIEKHLPCSHNFAKQHPAKHMSRWNENAFQFYQIGDEGHEYLSPCYTASLDAAMTLAMPNWWLRLGGPLSPAAYGWSREEDRVFRAGFDMIDAPYSAGATGATLTLALTAAALRARAHMEAK